MNELQSYLQKLVFIPTESRNPTDGKFVLEVDCEEIKQQLSSLLQHQLNLDFVDDNASRKMYEKMVESLIQHKMHQGREAAKKSSPDHVNDNFGVNLTTSTPPRQHLDASPPKTVTKGGKRGENAPIHETPLAFNGTPETEGTDNHSILDASPPKTATKGGKRGGKSSVHHETPLAFNGTPETEGTDNHSILDASPPKTATKGGKRGGKSSIHHETPLVFNGTPETEGTDNHSILDASLLKTATKGGKRRKKAPTNQTPLAFKQQQQPQCNDIGTPETECTDNHLILDASPPKTATKGGKKRKKSSKHKTPLAFKQQQQPQCNDIGTPETEGTDNDHLTLDDPMFLTFVYKSPSKGPPKSDSKSDANAPQEKNNPGGFTASMYDSDPMFLPFVDDESPLKSPPKSDSKSGTNAPQEKNNPDGFTASMYDSDPMFLPFVDDESPLKSPPKSDSKSGTNAPQEKNNPGGFTASMYDSDPIFLPFVDESPSKSPPKSDNKSGTNAPQEKNNPGGFTASMYDTFQKTEILSFLLCSFVVYECILFLILMELIFSHVDY